MGLARVQGSPWGGGCADALVWLARSGYARPLGPWRRHSPSSPIHGGGRAIGSSRIRWPLGWIWFSFDDVAPWSCRLRWWWCDAPTSMWRCKTATGHPLAIEEGWQRETSATTPISCLVEAVSKRKGMGVGSSECRGVKASLL